MKKNIKFYLLPVIVLLFISDLYADAGTEKRNSCFILKRYVAWAKLKDPDTGWWDKVEQKVCSGTAHAFKSAQDYCSGSGPFVAAEAEATSSATGEDAWYYILGCSGWDAGEDVTNILPIHSDYAMFQQKLDNLNYKKYFSTGKITASNITFNEQSSTIIISDLSAFIAVSSLDIYNDYSTFAITVKNYSDEDNYEIVWQARAFIYKGQLVIEGDLDRQSFITENLEAGNKYSLAMPELTIPIDATNLNWENLGVSLAVDGGNLGRGISNKYAIDFESDQVKEIDAKIKPSSYTFDVTQTLDNAILVSISFNHEVTGDIFLNSIDGKLIKVLESNFSVSEVTQVKSFNLSDIQAGVYFVKFENDKYILSRKIIIVK